MLVEGKWQEKWQPYQVEDGKGGFVRQTSSMRDWVTPDGAPGPTGDGGFAAEAGRYVLYVALTCPWASRTLMARALKRLESVIDVVVATAVLTEQGWHFGDFPGATVPAPDMPRYMHELYTRAMPTYTGRATVPVLWDRKRNTIVNNESADIVRMLDRAFDHLTDSTVDLYPADLAEAIDTLNDELYENLNNGVYKAGFAKTQAAYDEAVTRVFATLDRLEIRLGASGRFLLGDRLTESDVRLFVTLVRFDTAYHGLFKCNLRRISDYSHLSGYLERMLELEGVANTVNVEHIKAGYYSIEALNPSRIIPAGPALSWTARTAGMLD